MNDPMLTDAQFDALEWHELRSLRELKGAVIDDLEPICFRPKYDEGDDIAGIMLYLTGTDGKKFAVDMHPCDEEGDDSLIALRADLDEVLTP